MPTQNEATAHSLYILFKALPEESKQLFLQELIDEQAETVDAASLYLACKAIRKENEFLTDDEAKAFIDSLPQ